MSRAAAFAAALLLAGATAAGAQGGADSAAAPPAAETLVQAAAAPLRAAAGSTTTVVVSLRVAPGWHVNSNPPAFDYNIPTRVTLAGVPGIAPGASVYPPGRRVKLAFEDQPLQVYDGTVEVRVPLTVDARAAGGAHALAGRVDYQACNDQVCLAPTHVPFTVALTVTGGAAPAPGAAAAAPGGPPPPAPAAAAARAGFVSAPPAGGSGAAQQRLEGALARGGPWWFLALFVGGLLLNLTPCVFPMLGVTVSIFGARRREPLPRVLAHATLYVLGLCVMYSALGVAAALTGGLFGALLQNAWVNVGLGALLIGLSLGMFGVFEMQPPAWVLNRLGGANATSALGLFVSGLGVGIIAAPCVGPFVVAVLALVARRGSAPFGLATMFTLSFGLGFPYLFLATFSNLLQRLPRSGGWMEWVKKVFGVVMSAIGLDYVLLGLAPRLSPWVLPAALLLGGLYLGFLEKSANERRGFVGLKRGAGLAAVAGGVALVLFMQGAAARALTFRPYDAGAVAASLAAGRPVMLDFSADWCVPCHELELETFADPRVVAAAHGFDAYRVDLTRYDSAESGRWRAQYAVAGVPTVVFLRPGGNEARAARVEGFVPADAFLARLKRVAP